MNLEYPCDNCLFQPKCKTYDAICKALKILDNSSWRSPNHRDEWPLISTLKSDEDIDGLTFDLRCEYFKENKICR